MLLGADDTLQRIDPSARTTSPPIAVDAGPHALAFGAGGVPPAEHLFVANAGAGTVSVVDEQVTKVERTLAVGGKPVGIAETIDSRGC